MSSASVRSATSIPMASMAPSGLAAASDLDRFTTTAPASATSSVTVTQSPTGIATRFIDNTGSTGGQAKSSYAPVNTLAIGLAVGLGVGLGLVVLGVVTYVMRSRRRQREKFNRRASKIKFDANLDQKQQQDVEMQAAATA
ncbi:hypothetical protein OIV83_005591 [Microbotryomycetes sp. JL201]|nr:hypothetical protein OIV83_005591 [Microbotryomycetes sp. JL201]